MSRTLPLTNVVILTGLPVIDESKKDKLSAVLTKTIKKRVEQAPSNIDIPLNDERKSQGFAFVTFKSDDVTLRAVDKLDNFAFDKKHTFRASLLDDIHKFENVPDDYPGPPKIPPTESTPTDLHEHLLDRRARPQLLMHYSEGDDVVTSIHSIDNIEGLKHEFERHQWAHEKLGLRWSTHGTYAAAFHDQGISLWGGKSFKRIMKFAHPHVRALKFSANESFLMTSTAPDRQERLTLKIWETLTGKELRTFNLHISDGNPFESFKISNCERYLARIMRDKVAIYDLFNDLEPIRKSIIKETNVMAIAWSPKDPILSLYIAEGMIPSRIMILAFDKNKNVKQIRVKTIVQVKNIDFYWAPNGDYLLCKILKTSKSGKTDFMGFELFKLREREVPCITLPDLKAENVTHVAWDPTSPKFAYIESETPRIGNLIVSMIKEGKVVEIARHNARPLSHIYWSPKGSVFAAVGIASPGTSFAGHVDFCLVTDSDLEVIEQTQHSTCITAQWATCGRYFLTANVASRSTFDNGFNLYNLRGKLIESQKVNKFYHVFFRPTPPPLLSKEKLDEINSTLKEKWDEFKREDDLLRNLGVGEQAERRRKLRLEWLEYQQKWEQQASQWKARDVAEWKEKEEVVEEVIDCVEEEIVEKDAEGEEVKEEEKTEE
ncbi:hypothetical protein P9112_014302 [Eukaryota sp. TZLM1-RC]